MSDKTQRIKSEDRPARKRIMQINDLVDGGDNPLDGGSPLPKPPLISPKMSIRRKPQSDIIELVIEESDGKRVRRSLETTDEQVALGKVPETYAGHVRDELQLQRPLLNDFFFTYMDAIHHMDSSKNASYESRRNVVNRMRCILRAADIDPAEKDIAALANKVGPHRLFLGDWYKSVHGASASTMRQAKSLFTKAMIRYYRKKGIDTHWFNDWILMDVGSSKVKPFNPKQAERQRIVDACEALRFDHPEFYKVYLLGFGCGMRSSEIQRARYSDFHNEGDEYWFDVRKPKCVTGATEDTVQERVCEKKWYDEIMSLGSGDNPIITGTHQLVIRRFPQFLRKHCGMEHEKYPLHRLRKYAGHGIYIRNGNNMEAAAHALGHTSLEITRKIYTGRPRLMTDSQSA